MYCLVPLLLNCVLAVFKSLTSVQFVPFQDSVYHLCNSVLDLAAPAKAKAAVCVPAPACKSFLPVFKSLTVSPSCSIIRFLSTADLGSVQGFPPKPKAAVSCSRTDPVISLSSCVYYLHLKSPKHHCCNGTCTCPFFCSTVVLRWTWRTTDKANC